MLIALIAVAVCLAAGYSVIAATTREEHDPMLRSQRADRAGHARPAAPTSRAAHAAAQRAAQRRGALLGLAALGPFTARRAADALGHSDPHNAVRYCSELVDAGLLAATRDDTRRGRPLVYRATRAGRRAWADVATEHQRITETGQAMLDLIAANTAGRKATR